MSEPETIHRAAIRHGDPVYSVIRPGRHHNVAHQMFNIGLDPEAQRDQGFVTSTGRFVDREEACVIARAAGQIKVKTGPEHVLFSEDVW